MSDDKSLDPKVVRNKDIPLLADVLSIMQHVKIIEERISWQKGRLYNITSILTGMPRSGSSENKYEMVFGELSVLDEKCADLLRQYIRKVERAQRIINQISSQSMRTFVVMKYIMDEPNTTIMNELNMTRRGFERAVKSIEEAPNMARVVWHEKYVVEE